MLRFSALIARIRPDACRLLTIRQFPTIYFLLSNFYSKTTAAGSACRSMGEGHKVNGKGQNDIYMCKVDVALNSAEAKSAWILASAFTTAAHPVRL